MHIIVNVHSSNPHYSAGCEYAVVDLTPALVKQIHRRVALARSLAQKDRDLYELVFWGGTAEFYSPSILEACQAAVAAASDAPDPDQAAGDWLADLEQWEYAVVPEGVDLAAQEAERTECDQMVVQVHRHPRRVEFSVYWTASPNDTDLEVTTGELPLTAMKNLLAAHRSDRSPSLA